MKPVMNVLSFFIVLTLHSIGAAQTVQKKALTLEEAKKVIAAAVAKAKNKNAPGGAIAVVDEGGNLIAVERLDNTFAAGANISIGKARTAVLFKRPTKFFEDVINNGRTAMTALPDFTPLQGGIPIIVDGQIIGAVVTAGPIAVRPHEVNVEVVRLDPAIDAIVPLNPKIFKLAEGFQFTAGPIWMKNGDFLFSDPNANKIYKHAANGTLSVFKNNSGYSGKDIAEYFRSGSSGRHARKIDHQ
jgi:glc operon protein GlcG